MSELEAFSLLTGDIHGGDYETCLHAINQLCTVAIALGPHRTRAVLVPFLHEFTDTENDEAQAAVARQLGEFAPLVGGAQYLPLLLPILEKYCGEEEFVVRDTAVQSLRRLLPLMTKGDLVAKFVPILKRLSNGDWFTTRVSACGLFAVCYPLVPESVQTELRSLFNNLCNDDTPMVRKAAFTALGLYALTLQRQFYKTDIFPIVKAIAVDDMDAMRVFAIDACSALASVVDAAEFHAILLPLLDALQDDASWRVRAALAKHFAKICTGVREIEGMGKKLFAIFIKLLRDREAEVRSEAAEQIDSVLRAVTTGPSTATASMPSESNPVLMRELIESLAPALDQLASDGAQLVKVSLSKSLIGICPVLGRDWSCKFVIPVLQTLSKDEYYEVRHYALLHLETLIIICGISAVSSLVLPVLIDAAKDPKWRVRYACLHSCHLLAYHMGSKAFEKRLLPCLITALSDHVYAVRQLACRQLGLVANLVTVAPALADDAGAFGARWCSDRMLPQCTPLFDKTTNYLHRMTVLLLIEQIAANKHVNRHKERDIDDDIAHTHETSLRDHAFSATAAAADIDAATGVPDTEFLDLFEKHVYPLIVQACSDDVPNVRVAAAKTVTVLAETGRVDRRQLLARFHPVLSKLTTDTDSDAAFFAAIATRACQ